MKEDTRTRSMKGTRTQSDSTYDKVRGTGRNNPHLARLKDLDDYQVASEDPDVRGWSVISGDNEKIGTVDELIVDTDRMKVRYLVVDTIDKFAADKDDHYMLVPVGAARLHEKNNDVVVSGITTHNSTNYPVYRGESITRDHEHSVRGFYEAGGTVPAAGVAGSVSQHETIRDAHTGKIYERRDDVKDRDADFARDNSPNETSYGTGQISDLPEENRMKDRTRGSSNTISGDSSIAGERRPDGQTTLGQSNLTTGGEVRERIGTSGISGSRTSSLPNKELRQGPPPSDNPEQGRVRIHDTEPDVEAPKGSAEEREDNFRSTSDMSRSTSLGEDTSRRTNMGNLENKKDNPGIHDRSRMSSPEFTERTTTPGGARHPEKYPDGSRPVENRNVEHRSDELPDDRYDPNNDEFYTHDHFDEEKFYGNRRKR
ncbi:PRC-barrel domain-containing protein [Nafulsella turpanensis]|uniref:PRC-barrel domain-containing protein n=1 Tax=Nafulsella turpanensis TaxID=1265690 RepID=UPI00036EA537|nr:PRC-barrel domain-containing protein [Nafulsella turpanensis]